MSLPETIPAIARAEEDRGVHSSHARASGAARLSLIGKALRIHQWIKNLLVVVPLLMAHRATEAPVLLQLALAFIAWSLCASSVYLVNDLLDRETDRLHPYKRHRPHAAGMLGKRALAFLSPALAVPGLTLAFLLLPFLFGLSLLLYLALSTAYSFYLKRLLVVDVLVLATLYTLRVLSGGFATGVEVSPWLLTFSMFLFLSLAFVKRYTELRTVEAGGGSGAQGRGYTLDDLELLKSFGTSSGYLSVLVLALYINNSREALILYKHPAALWLIGPCLLYWITRVWLLASRGKLHDDPVVFTVKDPVSYVLGALVAIILIGATL